MSQKVIVVKRKESSIFGDSGLGMVVYRYQGKINPSYQINIKRLWKQILQKLLFEKSNN